MTRQEINKEYFMWMRRLVSGDGYSELLSYLNNTDFNYIVPMDSNRAEDGVELRYRFGNEYNIDEPIIAVYLDNRPCSVLEMMVALSVRCEEHIMDDPDIGDRTSKWFWDMIGSLGLGSMNDLAFNANRVKKVIDHFLNREYQPNGKGGLFTVSHCRHDLRSVDIWYQLMWYLNENLR